jgi:hypothetical protein
MRIVSQAAERSRMSAIDHAVPKRLRRSETEDLRKIYDRCHDSCKAVSEGDRWWWEYQYIVPLEDDASTLSLMRLGKYVDSAAMHLRGSGLRFGEKIHGFRLNASFYCRLEDSTVIEVADHQFQRRAKQSEFLRIASQGLRLALGAVKDRRSTLAYVFDGDDEPSEESD